MAQHLFKFDTGNFFRIATLLPAVNLLERETADFGIALKVHHRFAYAETHMNRERAAPSMPRSVVSCRKHRKIPHEEVNCNKLDMSNYYRHEIIGTGSAGRRESPPIGKETRRNGWKTRKP